MAYLLHLVLCYIGFGDDIRYLKYLASSVSEILIDAFDTEVAVGTYIGIRPFYR